MITSQTVAGRLHEIARALDIPHPTAANADRVVSSLVAHATEPDHRVSYLILAVLGGGVPHPRRIYDFTRRWRLDGLRSMIEQECRRVALALAFSRSGRSVVRVQSGFIVDVTDTGRSKFTTGIQRVARETLSRWTDAHEITCVTWTADGKNLHQANKEETSRATLKEGPDVPVKSVIIPFEATFILPEIAVDSERASRIRTIARFSGGRSVAIGFDCIPVTSAETAGLGMPGAFSKYLSTIARFSAVATISSAAQTEYEGWRTMLGAAGLVGPDIREIELPFASGEVSESSIEKVKAQLSLGDSPVVLSIGSHEPRKNHLRLLVAAELRWRAGDEFTLVMVGGNSWDASKFERMVIKLRAAGRRIVTLSNASDEIVWSLYHLARFSVFCSLNEGFGLPVVESLSAGTPVITSNFGSMRELGEGFGAVLVDPRDTNQISEAIGAMLGDDARLMDLVQSTQQLPIRTWDDYASELWSLVVNESAA